MKKLSFFLMAMLISVTSFAAEATATLSFANKAQRTVFNSNQQVWEQNGITLTNDKASSTSAVADYANPARFYKSSKLTIKCNLGAITKIEFDCNSSSYATALKSSITSGTVTVSSDKVTVVPATESEEYVIASLTGGQVRMDALTVTYVVAEEDPNLPVYTITATSADETMGTVAGAGEYAEGKTVTLTANANPGYEFVKWSNESTENPLIFEATENVTLTASFVAQTPITIAEANKLGDSKTAVLNEFTVTYVYKSYIHIQDASGYGMIFQSNFGLKVGDVVSGLTCSKSTYNGLPQFIPTCKLADLTIEAGEAPAVVELTTAPTGNYHQVVKLMNLQMTGSFVTDSYSTINATCPDGKTIAIYNAKNNLAYTFVADKTYNITGDVCQFSGKIQVSAYAIEEYVAPEPCTLATPVNWDAPIAAEANTDKWYAVNIASAIAAKKDIALTVANSGAAAVEVTVEAYANCPATEKIAGATSTINAGATKTTTVKYDEYLADQVEVVYLHVVTSGDLTVDAEVIEPCTQATAINWDAPIAAAANLDAWYAVNVESAIAAGKDLALTVSNPSTEAVEVSIEAYADCPATELIVKSTSTINAGASKTTTVKYDEYLADQVKVVYMHVTTKGGEIKVEAETVKFNVTATAENGTVEGAGIYEQGAEATLTATPAEGYEFVNWTVDGAEVSTENPYTFVVIANVALVANFKEVVTEEPLPEGVPTNEELWEAFKPYYNTFYGDTRDLSHPIANVATFMTKGEKILTDATSEYKWLGDYLVMIATEQGYTINSEALWRWHADAFFQANQHTSWPKSADFTEAGKPENWGPYYLAAQKPAEPATETVYFVNAANWTGTINAYAWEPVQNANWPGAPATKEAEQIAGYDVYSYTAEAGTYANVIFNNGSAQTADLKWTAGKYYVLDGWYTKEEAEAKLATPIEDEVVYFVNNKGWSNIKAYAWAPQNADWPGVAATKEAEQIAGYDVYSYAAAPGTYANVIFNGDGGQTKDLVWTAGKYCVNDTWMTKEEAETALTGSVTPPVITYVLMGVKGDWTTGIAMTQNPDNANEYVLLGQDIAEGDAVKVVTLTDGTATAWCGNVDEYSVAHSADDMGNIVLAPGKYDFYYKVAEDLIYIGATAPVEPEYEVMELTMTDLEVMSYGNATGLWASDPDNGIEVMLFLDAEGNLMEEESSIAVGWNDYTVTGTVTKAYNEELATDVYTAELYTTVGETNYKLIITMYAVPVEVVEVVVEDATITVEELPDGVGGTYESINVSAQWGESTLLIEGIEKNFEGFVMITEKFMVDGEEDWYIWMGQNATVTTVDNVLTVAGEFKNNFTGSIYNVTISGTLPVEEEEVEKEDPVYTDNALNPYAFGLTSKLSADKSTLIVNYRLNNSKATDVDVVIYNGTEVVKVVAGTTDLGKNTVEIPTADLPGGVELTWSVIVNGTSVEAPTREEKIYSFYHPSGLDIDINPENETFGLLLVNEGMHSVKDKTEGYVSAGFGAGIFAFTPSFDLVANGDKPGYNGGIEFTNTRADGTGTAYAPRRIRISEDGRIFVTSLNTDGNYLWEVNPANMDEWTTVFKGTLNDQRELVDAEGNFVAAPNNGFDVKGSGENLQLAMYSVNLSGITAAAMSGFRLHEYNLGTATEWTTAPSKAIVEGKYAINYTGTQVEYDNEGGLWICSYRSTASDANPGLVHINAEGVEDAKLVWNNVRQAGIRFNKDFTKLVVAGNNGAAKKATIYTISKDANGAPVLTQETVIDMAVVGNNLNDFAWDYAGNLYACGNSSEKLAAWAMPYSGEVETPAASKYAFQLEGKTEVEYEVYEDEITNLVIDYDNMLLIGGPSANLEVDVYLGLGDYDRNTDKFALLPESSVAIRGIDATFVEGWASVDGIAQTANAVVRCVWNEMNIELHLAMSAATIEPTVVVVENAAIEIEKVLLFGDMYDYALKMTGTWTDAEGLNYPVLVEVPVYYPEATEPYEIYSTVTVGGWGDEDPWLGFGEGYLTITPEGQKITAAGIVENPMAGIAIDITISGTTLTDNLENATVIIKSVKKIQNGQLIIEKDGVQYNAQGAILK